MILVHIFSYDHAILYRNNEAKIDKKAHVKNMKKKFIAPHARTCVRVVQWTFLGTQKTSVYVLKIRWL